MSTKLTDMMATIERLPDDARERVAEAVEFEAAQLSDTYEFTPADLEAIEEGKRAAKRGDFATTAEVTAVFTKFRQ